MRQPMGTRFNNWWHDLQTITWLSPKRQRKSLWTSRGLRVSFTLPSASLVIKLHHAPSTTVPLLLMEPEKSSPESQDTGGLYHCTTGSIINATNCVYIFKCYICILLYTLFILMARSMTLHLIISLTLYLYCAQ